MIVKNSNNLKCLWRAARDKSENFYTSRVRELLSLTKNEGVGTRPLSGGEMIQVLRAEFGIPYALAYTTVKRAVLRFDPES
jgi:hypothetical protein